MPVRIFIHGLESSNRGTKSMYFREKYPGMIIPTFAGNLQERMKQLREVLAGKTDIRLVGSSFGGLMASLYAQENETHVARMILLAPAINLSGFLPSDAKAISVSVPVTIYHGKEDEVIPLKEVETLARKMFSDLCFHAVDDDHFLHKTFKTLDWGQMLS